MTRRWRGRAVLATGLATAVLGAATAILAADAPPTLRVTSPEGELLASVPLPPDGMLTLRYRNSLYGTLAEERFVVTGDGQLQLVGLAAEQLAVLEEYYAIDEPATAAPAPMHWQAQPANDVLVRELRIAATDLGERTILVAGAAPIELWTLVDDHEPTIVLAVADADGD
jgi:hypothetical protein